MCVNVATVGFCIFRRKKKKTASQLVYSNARTLTKPTLTHKTQQQQQSSHTHRPSPQIRYTAQGETGEKGESGPAGPAALAGERGPPGDRGIDGPNGPQGSPGALGKRGPRGTSGRHGRDGRSIPGPEGPPGKDGSLEFGARGPHGPPGQRGFRGPRGNRGASVVGNAGMHGLNGNPGPKGYRGHHGDAGPTGDRGVHGPRGPTGPVEASFQTSNVLGQITAQGMCTGRGGDDAEGYRAAVLRECGGGETCTAVCARLTVDSAPGKGTCVDSMSVYGSRSTDAAGEGSGLVTGWYESCTVATCGPNYCCCSLGKRPE
jgi:hypothetical protein